MIDLASFVDYPLIFLAILWGFGGSWIIERNGWFQKQSASVKQWINSGFALIGPIILGVLAPYWDESYGDLNEIVRQIYLLLVPAALYLISWISSQVGHKFDPIRQKPKETIERVIGVYNNQSDLSEEKIRELLSEALDKAGLTVPQSEKYHEDEG